MKESCSLWEQILSFKRSSNLKRDIIVENQFLIQYSPFDVRRYTAFWLRHCIINAAGLIPMATSVLCLFLAVPWVDQWSVIVGFHSVLNTYVQIHKVQFYKKISIKSQIGCLMVFWSLITHSFVFVKGNP